MCCFFLSLVFAGPRLAFLIYWLLPSGAERIALAFDSWFIAFIGFLFVPWTTLMYVIIYPISGFDWVLLGLAVFADIATYAASSERRSLPGYDYNY